MCSVFLNYEINLTNFFFLGLKTLSTTRRHFCLNNSGLSEQKPEVSPKVTDLNSIMQAKLDIAKLDKIEGNFRAPKKPKTWKSLKNLKKP